MVAYADISFRREGAVARITVERPEKLNAYRDQTADELFDAFFMRNVTPPCAWSYSPAPAGRLARATTFP